MTPEINVDDIVMLKNNGRLWKVKSLFISASKTYEAFLEICGEAWCRTKIAPVAKLSIVPKDLSSHVFMID